MGGVELPIHPDRQTLPGVFIAEKDSEFLTYDLLAKSKLVDYIRKYNRPNVYVLDPQKKLETCALDSDKLNASIIFIPETGRINRLFI